MASELRNVDARFCTFHVNRITVNTYEVHALFLALNSFVLKQSSGFNTNYQFDCPKLKLATKVIMVLQIKYIDV